MATTKKVKSSISSGVLRKGSLWFLFVTPILLTAIWTVWPAVKVFLAVSAFNSSEVLRSSQNAVDSSDLKRNIQKYLLSWDIYVATDDMASSSELKANESIAWEDVRKLCSDGDFFVWLPLEFRVPVIGALEREWCWTLKS